MSKSLEERRAYRRKWNRENPEKVLAARRRWNEKHREYIIQWEAEHPDKVVATRRLRYIKHPERGPVYNQVCRRVKNGGISKPAVCSVCGKTKVRIEGHHFDYNKPYELTWICQLCHKVLHRNLRRIE